MNTTEKIKILPVDKKHTDYILGCVGEEQTLIRLRNKFGNKVEKFKDFFHPFDYYIKNDEGDLEAIFEVKTRRCNRSTYPTLVFGKNKFNYANKICEDYKSKNKTPPRVYILWFLNSTKIENKRILYLWEMKTENTNEYNFGKISNDARNQAKKDAVFVYTKYLIRLRKYKLP